MKNERVEREVSVNEMITILKGVDKSTFINVTMETIPNMVKTGNEFYDKLNKSFSVRKLSTCNYLIGNDYETRVNSNEVKEGLEGNFESFKPSGKSHVSKCVLVDDKTQSIHYLMVERFDEISPIVEYRENGVRMDVVRLNLMKSFLVKVSETSRQDQERKVMVITPKIENIKECTLNGVHYIVNG
jgi:hypothetical protein